MDMKWIMPSFQKHCSVSEDRFGCSYDYVHLWLDEFAKTHFPSHRHFRHHKEGVEEVRKKWGDMAAKAAELHIQQDMGFIPTKDWWTKPPKDGIILI